MSINNIAIESVLIGFISIISSCIEKQTDERKTETIRINQNDFVYLKSNQNKSEILQLCINYAKVSQ